MSAVELIAREGRAGEGGVGEGGEAEGREKKGRGVKESGIGLGIQPGIMSRHFPGHALCAVLALGFVAICLAVIRVSV